MGRGGHGGAFGADSDNSDDEDNVVVKDATYHKWYRIFRHGIVAVSSVLLVCYVVLSATRAVYHAEEDGHAYDPRISNFDAVATHGIECLLIVVCVGLRGTENFVAVAFYSSLLFPGLLLSKALCFRLWTERPWDTTAWVVALTTSCVFPYVLHRIRKLEVPNKKQKVSLTWNTLRVILRPFFLPHGCFNKFLVLISYLVMFAGKACTIVSPIIFGQIVTDLADSPPKDPSVKIYVFVALTLAPTFLRNIQDTLLVKVWQHAYLEVAETTFRHVHTLSLDWHLRKKMGSVIRAMDRGMEAADTLMYYMMQYLFPAFAAAVIAFVIMVLHFDMPIVAMISFTAFYVYLHLTFCVTVWRRKFREKRNKHDNEMHDKATDSLVNFETVKYFSNEDYEAKNYVDSVREYQKYTYQSQASVAFLNVSQSTVIQLGMLGTLLVAAHAVVSGNAGNAGVFVALQMYVANIFQPLSFLGTVYAMIINSAINLQNLCDLLNEDPDIVDKPNAVPLVLGQRGDTAVVPIRGGKKHATEKTMLLNHHDREGSSNLSGSINADVISSIGSSLPAKNMIEFRHVSFRYKSQREGRGLVDVSFSVPHGTTTAIVGQTGSGKTTVSRLLFRFYEIDKGEVMVAGQNVSVVTQKSLRDVLGIVPQDTVLFNDTIRSNIMYGRPNATQEEVEHAADQAKLLDFIKKLEKGWETRVGERGLKLSGGEKQRVAIARCLLKNPPIVVMDEATSALDNKTEKEVQGALQALVGRTTLVIAHRLSTIQNADQIIVMKDGVIEERGTHEQLLSAGGEYHSMWNAQLKAAKEGHTTNNNTAKSKSKNGDGEDEKEKKGGNEEKEE